VRQRRIHQEAPARNTVAMTSVSSLKAARERAVRRTPLKKTDQGINQNNNNNDQRVDIFADRQCECNRKQKDIDNKTFELIEKD